MIDSDLDLLLLLLYAKEQEEIVGITRLEKLIFLLIQSKEFKKFQKVLQYEEYDYGPWSSQIIDNIEVLSSYGLVVYKERALPFFEKDYYQDEIEINFDQIKEFHENNTKVYSLSSDGTIVAQDLFSKLTPNEKGILQSIKARYNSLSLNQLIRHVYHFYPTFTKKSLIKDKVIKLSPEEELRSLYPSLKIAKK